jgi:hypothetical protein
MKNNFFLIFTAITVLNACQKKPKDVVISSNKTETYSGFAIDEVVFTATANDAFTYKWDFGDGN